MKPFSAIVLGVFVFLALFGVFMFATFTASRSDQIGQIQIWGSVPRDIMDELLTEVRGNRDDFNGVQYEEVIPAELVPRLVQAIAAGHAPDIVLFPSESLVRDGDKLIEIPYSTISRRDYQDTFVEAGEAFLTATGTRGVPFWIDPLVMYWNRTLFSNAAVARPPAYWDEFITLAPRLTKKSAAGTLTQSAAALGDWNNIANAKGILVTLMNQLGSSVIELDSSGRFRTTLSAANDTSVGGADSALRFWTDFADPLKPSYSWNRSQKNSRDAFLAGTLATYIAPASELIGLREANPNLNFDVAPVPVARGAGEGVVARVDALAIPRGAPNPAASMTVIFELASSASQSFVSTSARMPSARRDVEPDTTTDAFLSVFRRAALASFVFFDPDPARTNTIFGTMVDNISSGRKNPAESVRAADDELQQLLREIP